MAVLPEIACKAWENHEGPVVLSTVNKNGMPNAIYVTCIKKISEDKFVIADNYFNKTRANIAHGSNGSLLFITKEGKSDQIKGSFEYFTSGAIYDDMKTWLAPKYPGEAATVLHVEEVYSGAEKLL